MNYPQTLDFLYKQLPMFQRTGAAAYKADLSTTIELCNRLNNPQLKFPAIHVAGTNGKGSVSHFIASILYEAGYRTGLFTSPHLKDFRERIRVNGKKITPKKVVDFVELNRDRFGDLKPSFFEYTFAMAMHYFACKKADVVVAETGMGGRLDSTNIVNPVLSVITNIGYDHMQFLGDTLQKIAVEKAGIIKPLVPVIIGQRQNEVADVFLEKGESVKAPVLFADGLYQLENEPSMVNNKLNFTLRNLNNHLKINIESPLMGNYQVSNLLTVLASIHQLNCNGYAITATHIHRGIANVIKNTGLRGRWEVIQESPRVICDTAHNREGLQYVIAQLTQMQYSKLHIVLGVVSDKQLDDILLLFPENAEYYFCNAAIPRALPAMELQKEAQKYNLKGKAYKSVQQAYKAARKAQNPDDLLFIGGSTFVVGEIL